MLSEAGASHQAEHLGHSTPSGLQPGQILSATLSSSSQALTLESPQVAPVLLGSSKPLLFSSAYSLHLTLVIPGLTPPHLLPASSGLPACHGSYPAKATRDLLVSPASSYFTRTSLLHLPHPPLPCMPPLPSFSASAPWALPPPLLRHCLLRFPCLLPTWQYPQGSAKAPLTGPTILDCTPRLHSSPQCLPRGSTHPQ